MIISSSSAGLCILCLIIGLYVYQRKKRASSIHKYASNAQNEEDIIEMETCKDGDNIDDTNDCMEHLEKEQLKVSDE